MYKDQYIKLYREEFNRAFDSIPLSIITKLIGLVFETYDNEKSVYAAGNGGTVSYIQNMVADFNMHVFTSEDKSTQNVPRNKFKCVNLCSDQATLLGIANDLGLEHVYSEQLKYQGEQGDLYFGISGSGNSANIVRSMQVAKEKGMKTVLFTRNKENKCNQYADLVVCVDPGEASFPGQTGKNNFNFNLEDILSCLTHICVGLLKKKVADEN